MLQCETRFPSPSAPGHVVLGAASPQGHLTPWLSPLAKKNIFYFKHFSFYKLLPGC